MDDDDEDDEMEWNSRYVEDDMTWQNISRDNRGEGAAESKSESQSGL